LTYDAVENTQSLTIWELRALQSKMIGKVNSK